MNRHFILNEHKTARLEQNSAAVSAIFTYLFLFIHCQNDKTKITLLSFTCQPTTRLKVFVSLHYFSRCQMNLTNFQLLHRALCCPLIRRKLSNPHRGYHQPVSVNSSSLCFFFRGFRRAKTSPVKINLLATGRQC